MGRIKIKNRRKWAVVSILILCVFVFTTIFIIVFNIKQSAKNAEIRELNNSLRRTTISVETLTEAVDAYDQFRQDTNNQSAYTYTAGINALSIVDSIAGSDTSAWKTCNYNFSDQLLDKIDSITIASGTLSGPDKTLVDEWLKQAKIVADYAMCYKGEMVINVAKAPNGIDDFKSISLQAKGRLSSLKKEQSEQKKDINSLKETYPLFL